MVLRTSLAAFACGLISLTALRQTAAAQTLEDRLNETTERVLSKHGVDITGQIHSEYFHSNVSGSAVEDTNYSFETTQYTFFDLDMQYRPYDFVWAKADIRFYQDWQTFFATRSRILAARWLSMDGNLSNMLAFDAGDFHQKYSKLTLWAPELELTYEPTIFARARQDLMEEQYLGDNNRVLQGANLDFAKRFDSPLSELRLGAMGTRIRRAEYLDTNGYQGFDRSKSDMDRYLLAGNGEAFLFSNLFIGGSYLSLADDRESFRLSQLSPDFLDALPTPLPHNTSLNWQDSVVARDIQIISGRAGLDVAGFLNRPGVTLELLGEVARSSESNRYAWHFKNDTTGGAHLVSVGAPAPGKDGQALNAELTAGFEPADSAFGVRLTAEYIHNEAAFLNPLAQSPTFEGARIMNTENDLFTGKLYSTFDALDNGVYKFSPMQATASHQQAPYSKTSYSHDILSPEDLSSFHADPVVQLSLPFGSATPNRSGLNAHLTGQWGHAWHATVTATLLQEITGESIDSLQAAARSISEIGGGLRLEANRLFKLSLPLEVSASYRMGSSTRAKIASDLASSDIKTNLLMAGLDWQFFPKWGVLAGLEMADTKAPTYLAEKGDGADVAVHAYQYDMDLTQTHYRIGVQYLVAKDAYLLLSAGQLSATRKLTNKGTMENALGPIASRDRSEDFSQLLTQALIKVKF